MPIEDSSVHNIVLRAAHDIDLSGYKMPVCCGTKTLVVPHVCGCTSIFSPAGWTETGDDGVVREVWKQVGFEFKEYEHGS